ncbi:MAG: hypothetical protein JOZ05_10325 [Acetobacteraceae bacterium]|nr:hypothetical protein [Acetobacteraceae bacterium]
MPTAKKTTSPPQDEVLPAILRELQALNRAVADIARRMGEHAEGDMDPGRPIDPGDSVPEGVAPEAPVPLTPEDRKVRRALERLPRRRRTGESQR